MLLLSIDSCTDNSLGLHSCDAGISNIETASSVTHHRVDLLKAGDDSLDLLNGLAHCVCNSLDLFLGVGNELVKRGIKESDGNGMSLKSIVEILEILLLIRKDLSKSLLSLFISVGADHLTECFDTAFLEEHVLGTAKSDTFCAKLECSSARMLF